MINRAIEILIICLRSVEISFVIYFAVNNLLSVKPLSKETTMKIFRRGKATYAELIGK
jgi:hypothetical protein